MLPESLKRKILIAPLFLTAVFNTLIAVFLTQLGYGSGLTTNFIVSQSIGLCICAVILGGLYFWKSDSGARNFFVLLFCLPAGAGIGAFIGSQLTGHSVSDIFHGDPSLFIQMLFIGIVFGTPITYFFSSREKMAQARAQLKDEQILRLTLEKRAVEAHLKSLQAQIEPHFLFNTLSNILSLIDIDPNKSQRMLENLTCYLRSSLSTLRRESATLGEEIDLIQAYLNIQKIRIGERLRYRIDVPASLHGLPFPPMLLQPLVENAVQHGIEPKVEGGEILVTAAHGPGRVVVAVTDTGSGLADSAPSGVGLASVRERLQVIYGENAALILKNNVPCGLTAVLEIPDERG
jgi:hypothetical protein